MSTVADVMTRGVKTLSPSDTVAQAAQAMAELNVGSIPVCDGRKLRGIVTDRDITVRVVALGLDGQTKLSVIMSTDIQWTEEGRDLDEALREMASRQIRRLPVVDADKNLVGIVSLGDIATKGPDDEAGLAESLSEISEPAKPQGAGQTAG
ncbi:MAG: CBS domain-containing protein [Comamonadaceae bacterium]|nr:MAG: CBS domain-containing protein [Comamonadaceae bacterium]